MTNPNQERIIRFLKQQQVLTLATSSHNEPHCCNCFYVFLEKHNLLVFKSEEKTIHTQQALTNKKVAGTIYLAGDGISKVKGVQFTGIFSQIENELLSEAKKTFYKRFPFGGIKTSPFWGIKIHYVKMTDNTLGFGKKLEWQIDNNPHHA